MKILLKRECIFSLSRAGLRDKAHGIMIGTAISPTHFVTDPDYMRVAAAEFNSVTAQREMKWIPIGHDPNNPDYELAEELIKFATEHNQKVRGHTLIWHSSTPPWVEALENNPVELERVLVQHIK